MRDASRVLLIEHHQQMARPLKQGLEEEGFAVTVARDGAEGGPLALTGTYDVIILDLPFQEEDDLSLLQCWRHQGLRTPVLLLTGDSEEEMGHLDARASDYLSKPFNLDVLFSRLRSLVEQKQ